MLEAGDGVLDLPAHVVHHLLDAAPRERLQADEEVALVRLGDAAAELQAGAAGVGLHLGRAAQDVLDLAQQAVGLRQGGARRA